MPLAGEMLAIGSAVAWALTSVAMRPIAGRALWRSSLLRMLLCAALLALYAWPSGALLQAITAPAQAYLLLLGSTVCSMGVGDSLYFLSAARIGVARALPIGSAFPLLSTLGAVLILHETPTLALAVGTVLVVAAVVLIAGDRVRDGRRREPIGLLLAGLAACMWAASGLFLGPALQMVNPVAGNMIRFPMAALMFLIYLAFARPEEHLNRRLVWLSVAAAVGTLASALMFLGGLANAGVARGVALNATSPVFSAIFAALLLGEHVSRRVGLGIVASVVGTILLVV
ncbi:MAG TPA: DMT family transporter [Chloroflexota bacterium]|jgi:drug/metabolite transporter (DMT)-like permease|nr:DMT family transporter [Chloroflexota bacterium]